VLGAKEAGMNAVLVRTGKYQKDWDDKTDKV